MAVKKDLRTTLAGSHDRIGEWGRETAASLVGLHPFEVAPTAGQLLPAPHEDGNLDALSVSDTNALYIFTNPAPVVVPGIRRGRYAGQILAVYARGAVVIIDDEAVGTGQMKLYVLDADGVWRGVGAAAPAIAHLRNNFTNTINTASPGIEFASWNPANPANINRGGFILQADGIIVPTTGLYKVTAFLQQRTPLALIVRPSVGVVLAVDGVKIGAELTVPTGASGFIFATGGHNTSDSGLANMLLPLRAGQRVGMFTVRLAVATTVESPVNTSYLTVERV